MKTLHFLACLTGMFLLPSAGVAQTGLLCPANVTVACEDFSPSLAIYGLAEPESGACINSLTETPDWTQFDSVCRRGIISREFQATLCSGDTSSCQQQIAVEYTQDFYVHFPDDIIVTNCPPGLSYGEPTFFGVNCAQWEATFDDVVFGLSDVCFTITRTWYVKNACTNDPNLPLIKVPNPNPVLPGINPANMPGVTVSACDAPAPWNPSVVQITPGDTAATNYCTFWSANPNGYTYKQLIRIIDWSPPVVLDCPAGPVLVPDTTENDPALWQNTFNTNLPQLDFAETETDLQITATDTCSGENINIAYQLFLDLDADGVTETVVNSNTFSPSPFGLGWNRVYFGNVSGAGQARTFDNRPVPVNQKWGFALEVSTAGANKTARVRFNTALAPNSYVLPQLPHGKHRIKWSVTDGCGNETICEYPLTIQQGSANGSPSIACPPNVTVETSPVGCVGAYNYSIEFSGGTLSQTAGLPSGNFPFGLTINQFVGTDVAGNTASCSFSVTVMDLTPPAVHCFAQSTVLLGIDDPADCYGADGTSGGVQWVYAQTFNDGSADNCGDIHFTIRRSTPYSNCIAGLNTTNGHPDCTDVFPDFPSEFERAIMEGDSVKFYCCEAGSNVALTLRAYQLNADGSLAMNLQGSPIFSDCAVQVQVLNQVQPTCVAPPDVTVSCSEFDPTLQAYGAAAASDNCCMADLTTTVNWSQFDSICHRGSITRLFEAKDCQNNTSTCSQKIVVNYTPQFFIRFPDDVFSNDCPETLDLGEPIVLGNGCELLQISYVDQQITPVPDACIRIARDWSVINWCTFNPALPLVNVPNPNPNPILGHPSNLPGPIVSACNTPAPWAPTIVKINPTDPDSTNYCSYWSPTANGYHYTQIIRIIDVEGPEIANCPATAVTYADSTQNDPALWHNVFDPSQPPADLTEVEADLSISSSDACLNGYTYAQFFLFLDLDNNGTQETVVTATPLANADTIRFNNIGSPGFMGGTATTFDTRQVPTNQKWHFTLQNTQSAGATVSALRWNTTQQPSVFVTPELPRGTHKIKWIVADNCGNNSECEHTFTVQQGLSTGTKNPDQEGFALFQNEPNPFNRHTSIGFRLPEAGEAILQVFDAAGRQVYQKRGYFAQGLNQIALDAEWLPTTGILYYKLESGADTAWRKMIATGL